MFATNCNEDEREKEGQRSKERRERDGRNKEKEGKREERRKERREEGERKESQCEFAGYHLFGKSMSCYAHKPTEVGTIFAPHFTQGK